MLVEVKNYLKGIDKYRAEANKVRSPFHQIGMVHNDSKRTLEISFVPGHRAIAREPEITLDVKEFCKTCRGPLDARQKGYAAAQEVLGK